MLTVKQFRIISLVCVVLAAVLAIGSLSMARFAQIAVRTDSSYSSGELNIGAFHTCFELLGGAFSTCGTIDQDCLVKFNIPGLLNDKLPFDSADQRPDFYKDGCTKFNIFRGMHVTATLFLCIACILGGVWMCLNPATSPRSVLGVDITYCLLTALASIFYVVCLISADQSIGDLPSGTTSAGDTVSVDKWTSFWATAAAVGFGMVALIVWLVGRFFGAKGPAVGLEGMPLVDGNNGSYVPPSAAGQQQYFNYGAPAPQPASYGYAGQQQAANANYGFGYQPPPQQ